MSEEATEAGQDNANTGEESQTTEATTPESQETLLTGGNAEAGDEAEQDGGDQAASDDSSDGDTGDEVPESYEFEVPEGMELDQELVDAVTPIFKDLKLSQEKASALTKAYAERLQAQQQQQVEAFEKQLETWATELKNDKDVGGDAFEGNVKIARKTIDAFGSPELHEFLTTTGAGNHPALFKFALEIGKRLQADHPGSGNRADQPAKADYEKLYPSMPTVNDRRN
jgi:hypothetical protein